MDVFELVQEVYKLRSLVVHGSTFSTSRIDRAESESFEIVRKVFGEILSNDKLHQLFNTSDSEESRALLKRLGMGAL